MLARHLFAGSRTTGLIGALGCACVALVLGRSLTDLSYDLLFRLRPTVDLTGADVVIIDMDSESEKLLGQPSSLAWGRTNHVRLLEILHQHQARVVAFDVFFRDPDPVADPALLRLAGTNGRVFFATYLEPVLTPDGQSLGRQLQIPFGESVGLEHLGLVEKSGGQRQTIRRHHPGTAELPSLAWKAAAQTIDLTDQDRAAPRWVNYYGPPGTVPHISFFRVFSNTIPPSVSFTNKVVFVGGRASLGPTGGTGVDYFETPFGQSMPGVEVNATACLNLLRHDSLRRWPDGVEQALFVLLGLAAGFGLTLLRPLVAASVAGGLSLAGLIAAWLLFTRGNVWFPWLIWSAAQMPCALGWAVLVHTRRLSAEKKALEAQLGSDRQAAEATVGPRAATAPGSGSADAPTLLAATGGTRRIPGISDHTLLRCVGRGAYGEVWLARDIIGSFHAVKIVYRNSFDSEEPYEREFHGLQKYTPISRTHPGWVHMLHIGRNDTEGYFFCIMEAGDDEVSGQEIDPNSYQPRNLARELKKQGRLPVDECVRLGMALSEALEHLHRHRLIHRDIKPSNVIFVKGAPKFADIGLVTELKGADGEVSYLGTEGYIAPEGPGTAGADVYSLGKLLYEISMGRDRREFPELPTVVLGRPETPHLRRLQKIVMRACAEEPGRRYQSAAELSADLRELQRSLEAAGPHG